MGAVPGGVLGAAAPGVPRGTTSRLSSMPDWLMRTRFSPGTAATVMLPPGAVRLPVLMAVPPNSIRFCPSATERSPALTMLPGWGVVKANWLGSPTRVL